MALHVFRKILYVICIQKLFACVCCACLNCGLFVASVSYELTAYKQVLQLICLYKPLIKAISTKPNKCTGCPSICCHIKPYAALVYELAPPQHFLSEMSYCEVAYIIGASINNHLSISCNVCIIVIRIMLEF